MVTEINKDVQSGSSPLEQNFWQLRWENHNTAWDIGYPAPAICQFVVQYPNKNTAILIAGCGNAYEAEFLVEQGFNNITLIDIVPKVVEKLKEKFAQKPQIKVLCEDFFNHQGKYDLMIEQTFFCAIPPAQRLQYAQKAYQLLNTDGKLVGLLFNKEFEKEGPPFGGKIEAYKSIFKPYFDIKTMEPCYNSIESRKDTELFIHLIKSPKKHWENIYQHKQPNELSWTQDYPKTSIAFIRSFKLPKYAPIIDIGGGDSHLVDYLLEDGFENITVLDISESALQPAKTRLGVKANQVKWIVSDVKNFKPDTKYSVWHNRAAFHFFSQENEINAYYSVLKQATQSGSFAVIGTFSINGPLKYSELNIKQYTEITLNDVLATDFTKLRCITEDHLTPFNTQQNFLYCAFKHK